MKMNALKTADEGVCRSKKGSVNSVRLSAEATSILTHKANERIPKANKAFWKNDLPAWIQRIKLQFRRVTFDVKR
jgi:hypothetical protein